MSVSTMTNDSAAADGTTEAKRPKRKLLAMILVVALSAGASWLYLRPAEAEPAPAPGEVLKLDAIQLNLAAGHYLRIGLALQASEEAGEHVEGSKALDAAIELFSGRKVEDLAQPVQRKLLKEKLLKELEERYHGEVIDVYFTDFVTQ
jgi:flagellar FliL protein